MTSRLEKAWRQLDETSLATLGGQLGVYQLANAEGEIVFIGYAGGKSLFGMKGELASRCDDTSSIARFGIKQFRTEITSAYLTRYQELLMVHFADHGVYPAMNLVTGLPKLGRLSP